MRSETSFDLNGDLIFVDAVVVGPSGRATIQLLLDTGSVLTTLVPSIAQAIGYSASAMASMGLQHRDPAGRARIVVARINP